MKKQTRQRLMAISVLLILSMSSIAYVFYDLIGTQTQQIKPLTGYVVDGEIDQQLEATYVQNGWTFLKVYYNDTIDTALTTFLNQAPQTFTTSQGQTQLVVQKLTSAKNYAVMSNLNGENTIYNMTIDDLYTGLCSNLMALPTECALVGLNLSGF